MSHTDSISNGISSFTTEDISLPFTVSCFDGVVLTDSLSISLSCTNLEIIDWESNMGSCWSSEFKSYYSFEFTTLIRIWQLALSSIEIEASFSI